MLCTPLSEGPHVVLRVVFFIPVVLVTALIYLITASFYDYVSLAWREDGGAVAVAFEGVVFAALWFPLIVSYYRCVFTDPGSPPHEWVNHVLLEEGMRSLDEAEAQLEAACEAEEAGEGMAPPPPPPPLPPPPPPGRCGRCRGHPPKPPLMTATCRALAAPSRVRRARLKVRNPIKLSTGCSRSPDQ